MSNEQIAGAVLLATFWIYVVAELYIAHSADVRSRRPKDNGNGSYWSTF